MLAMKQSIHYIKLIFSKTVALTDFKVMCMGGVMVFIIYFVDLVKWLHLFEKRDNRTRDCRHGVLVTGPTGRTEWLK